MEDYRVDTLIKSVDDLQVLCQHSKRADDGEMKFSHSSFAFITKDHAVYFGRSPIKKLDTATVNKSLKRIPDKDIYPKAPPRFTRVTEAASRLFFKRPSLTFYDELEGSRQLAKVLLQEAEVLELLAGKPHPNIIQYHGCQVYRNRIVGLALEQHPYTLQECIINGSQDLDLESGLDGIGSAVKHLHSLRLAHNDIKPSNIMVSVDNTWVLVDFGSCRPFGEVPIMAGNPEWTTSLKENDEVALHNLRNWLSGKLE